MTTDNSALKRLDRMVRDVVRQELANEGIIVPRGESTARGAPINPTKSAQDSLAGEVSNLAGGTYYGVNRILAGFDLEAEDPPSQYVWIVNKAQGSRDDAEHSALVNGKKYTFTGKIKLNFEQYLNPNEENDVYIYWNEEGAALSPTRSINRGLEVGRVHFLKDSLRIADDYEQGNLDAYIISAKDPYYNGDFRVDDDSLAFLRNNLDYILAENIFGSLTLSEYLKILSEDGTIKIGDNEIQILDVSGNVVAKFNRNGVFFYSNTGAQIAAFTPSISRVSALEMLDDNALRIRDNNERLRVLLGRLSSLRDEWGFELYDEKGDAFMVTSRRRKWFKGAQITGRLLAVPLFALIFSASCAEPSEVEHLSYKYQFIDTSDYGDNVHKLLFDGNYITALVKSASDYYLLKIDIFTGEILDSINVSADYGLWPLYKTFVFTGNNKIVFLNSAGYGGGAYEYDSSDLSLTELNYTPNGLSSASVSGGFREGEYIYFSSDNQGIWKMKYEESVSLEYTDDNKYGSNDDNCTPPVFTGDYIYWFTDNTSDIFLNRTTKSLAGVDQQIMKARAGSAWSFDYLSLTAPQWDGKDVWILLQYIDGGLNLHKSAIRVKSADIDGSSTIYIETEDEAQVSDSDALLFFDGRYMWTSQQRTNYTVLRNIDINNLSNVGEVYLPKRNFPNVIQSCVFDGLNIWFAQEGGISRIPL